MPAASALPAGGDALRRAGWLLCLLLALATAAPARGADISGFVRDRSNGESLPFFNVYLKDQSRGSTSNESGYFVITAVQPGPYLLEASAVGYARLQRRIDVGADGLALLLEMEEEVVELRTTIVEAERDQVEAFDISPGRTVLQASELK